MDDWRSTMSGIPLEDVFISQENLGSLLDLVVQNGLLEQSQSSEFNVSGAALDPVPSTSTYSLPSALPAIGSWSGAFDFKVSFPPQENVKNTNWLYSETTNKIYVKKDAPCPFNFEVNHLIPRSAMIRAYAVFTRPDHAADFVVKCVIHQIPEIEKKVKEHEYLVRSDHADAVYEIDPRTKARSVLLPLANFSGSSFSYTHVFKFLCFTSCSGGPNRRPVTLVFNLEDSNQVLGRCSMNLKVCSSPKRDKNLDEQPSTSTSKVPLLKIQNRDMLPPSRSNKKKVAKKEFIIKVKDENCYRYLKEMELLFSTGGIMKYKGIISSSSDEATDSNF